MRERSFLIMENEQQQQVEEVEVEAEETQTEDKASKAVEKLQKRLGKVTGDKKTLEAEVERLKGELEEYQSGKKSVKKLSDEEKAKEADLAKDKELEKLRNELAKTKALQETSEVLKEQGLDVSADVLNMIVSADDNKTFANVKAIVSFSEQIANKVRSEVLTGTTPTRSGKQTKKVTQADFDDMSFAERAKLATEEPELFKQFTKGD